MCWIYQWLPVLLFIVHTAFCIHAQLPRSRGGRVKRFSSVLNILEGPEKRERHENVQRRTKKAILEQLELLIAALAKEKQPKKNNYSPFEAPMASSEDIEEEQEPFDKDGIFYLTKPKVMEDRLMNKAINKAAILTFDPLREQKDFLTKEEEAKLHELLLGEDEEGFHKPLRMDEGLSQPSGSVYRFDDLVA